jgi:O-antigen/teichoic acid export membrane protein
MIKKFFADSAIYGIINIFSRGLSLILLPLYTRIFSPTDYGIIDLISIVTNLVNLTVALEISQGLALYYSDAETDNQKTAYASTALWFTIATYSIFCLTALFFSDYLSILVLGTINQNNTFNLAIISIFTNGIFYLVQNQIRWQLKSREYALINFIFIFVSASVTAISALFFQLGLSSVYYGNISGYLISLCFGFYSCNNIYTFSFNWQKCREMLTFSFPLVLSSISVFISLYIDRITIKELMTLKDLGLYGIAYRFASIVVIFSSSFQGALTPLVYNNYRLANTPKNIAKIFRYFLALIFPTILIFSFFSTEIILFFSTPEYIQSSSIIPVIALSLIVSNCNIFTPGIAIYKQTRIIALINIFSAIINTVLNYILVPKIGFMGAALATLITSVLTFYCYFVKSQKYYFIEYSWSKIITATIFVSIVSSLIAIGNEYLNIFSKCLIFTFASLAILGILINKQDLTEIFEEIK